MRWEKIFIIRRKAMLCLGVGTLSRRYMAKILPIRRTIISIQSINQSINLPSI